MKRKIIALALIISAALTFSSCDDEEVTGMCFHDWQTNETEEMLVSVANCQSGAIYNSVCSKCGEIGSPYETGEKGDHSYAELVSKETLQAEATCTGSAVYFKSCEHCGKLSEETFTSGNPKQHNFQNIATVDTLISAATCSSPSTYAQSCADCHTRGFLTFTLGPSMPHFDTHGDLMCDHCNKPLKVFDDVPVDNLAGRHEFGN